MASVEYLIKQFLSEDKKILDLSNQVLGDKGAVALAKSKYLKRVTRLTLANNNISDEGAIAIANSEKFKKLIELDFYGNVIIISSRKLLQLTEYRKINKIASR